MSADPTQGVNTGQLNAMLQSSRMGAGGGEEFFSRWLFTILPDLQADQKPLVFETAAPFAFCNRNIFPMAQNLGVGNPGGILAKIIGAFKLQSLREVPNESLDAMTAMATAGIEADDNFRGFIAGNGAMTAMNAQMAAMNTGGGPEIG